MVHSHSRTRIVAKKYNVMAVLLFFFVIFLFFFFTKRAVDSPPPRRVVYVRRTESNVLYVTVSQSYAQYVIRTHSTSSAREFDYNTPGSADIIFGTASARYTRARFYVRSAGGFFFFRAKTRSIWRRARVVVKRAIREYNIIIYIRTLGRTWNYDFMALRK